MDITTNRLKIRSFRETDIEDVFEIYSNKNTCRFLLHEPWTSSTKDEEFQKKLVANQLTQDTAISLACEMDNADERFLASRFACMRCIFTMLNKYSMTLLIASVA